MKYLIDKLAQQHSLTTEEYKKLLTDFTQEDKEYAKQKAQEAKSSYYQNKIYIRGLIELTNYCKNDCYYCGIRRSNEKAERYRLSNEEILHCCKVGYELGFRTFVLQGGEDGFYNDERLVELVKEIRQQYSDCAITLSLGERSYESYKKLYEAGADRYLLRHETADVCHYESLHPKELTLSNRMICLQQLKDIGYQVGCGFMVGTPGQRVEHLVKDLQFIEEFQPEMVGIGPFLPHEDTPFAKEEKGSLELTLFLLSLLRLIKPDVLLPATTALGTIDRRGRELGIEAGANVVMPNLSPVNVRKKYSLYDHKICTGEEAAECIQCLKRRVESVCHTIVVGRGDPKKSVENGEEEAYV